MLKKNMKYHMIQYISWIPYIIWFVGMQMDLWDWFPAFFIAMVINGGLNYLLMIYGPEFYKRKSEK
jgi:hypothetical protein|tara:strand:- start:217 stop:414 length:198 start_codon:yes stop_codon:yes gene_type:complete